MRFGALPIASRSKSQAGNGEEPYRLALKSRACREPLRGALDRDDGQVPASCVVAD